ncbi:hypothetical protein SHKM778_79930 [Streptomyces sp. KM77-8]|uniref:Uncharacterized protein n=1 Tax=Streptomyces haneummycinicus TaxID=3074435 RepID=A0AAT9HVJ3_9ACTN
MGEVRVVALLPLPRGRTESGRAYGPERVSVRRVTGRPSKTFRAASRTAVSASARSFAGRDSALTVRVVSAGARGVVRAWRREASPMVVEYAVRVARTAVVRRTVRRAAVRRGCGTGRGRGRISRCAQRMSLEPPWLSPDLRVMLSEGCGGGKRLEGGLDRIVIGNRSGASGMRSGVRGSFSPPPPFAVPNPGFLPGPRSSNAGGAGSCADGVEK